MMSTGGPERDFRDYVQKFLHGALPPDWAGIGALPAESRDRVRRSWRESLAESGLLAVSWPREVGGAGLSLLEQVIVAEEFAKAGVPEPSENDSFGIRLLGNTILALGDAEQRQRFLPRILSGEDKWCQGFSEPGAGSDLAAISTRAELRGNRWYVTGQKIWTSAAETANWMFLLARTEPGSARHSGLTFLLLPMDQPGVTVRPIVNAAGYHGFNEVFLSEAETSAENYLGEVGAGWAVAMTLLSFERGSRVTTDAIRFGADIIRLVELATEHGMLEDPDIADRLAWCSSRVELMRWRGYRSLAELLDGQTTAAKSAMTKVIWSEFFQSYTELAFEILGDRAAAPDGPGNGAALQIPEAGTPNSARRWVDEYLYARAASIYAGTSEIQRDVIAQQLLGLPKEPRPA
ncbi:acyl-CoA dehydrogenase family protein [Nocardia fluminea]|uniref:acyl-CoA dehydrogenase family protein n=1 Tax=Nocardia fluminea TaxID=134984 RepID=UPI00343C4AB3